MLSPTQSIQDQLNYRGGQGKLVNIHKQYIYLLIFQLCFRFLFNTTVRGTCQINLIFSEKTEDSTILIMGIPCFQLELWFMCACDGRGKKAEFVV